MPTVSSNVRVRGAGSTGRRNTGVKSLLLGFQIARSQVVVHLAGEPLCSDRLASAATSRCPSESTVSAGRWCSRSTRAATGFAVMVTTTIPRSSRSRAARRAHSRVSATTFTMPSGSRGLQGLRAKALRQGLRAEALRQGLRAEALRR